MTGDERKKRGKKSAVIVERLVRIQLRAMGCERFDVGIKRDAGEMILREGQSAIELEKTIKWLRHENAKGAHIYIRPAGAHKLSLLDDLSSEAIERMKAEGFEPAVVVETSPKQLSGLVESRPGPRPVRRHASGQTARGAVRRRSVECRLEALRAARRFHQPERKAPTTEWPGAVRKAARSIWSNVSESV